MYDIQFFVLYSSDISICPKLFIRKMVCTSWKKNKRLTDVLGYKCTEKKVLSTSNIIFENKTTWKQWNWLNLS